jgi:2-methylcitrate dehydratase PrpD
MNVTESLARYIAETRYDQFPEEVIEHAKFCLLDWVAVTLVGAREEVSKKILETIKTFGGEKQATILGMNLKSPLPFAALVNGTSSHALDYDDVYARAYGHPSAPVIPAILAVSEWKGLSGKELIESLIIGVQVEFAIGEGVIPEHYDHGWHNTGTIGHFGSAAGVSKLLGLDHGKIENSLGIAATQAAGLRTMFGTMCKPLHAGKAAMNGLLSGLWAQEGVDSAADCLGGDLGFLSVYSSNPNPQKVVEALSGGYHILKARFKDYPSCRSTHAVIDGIVELRNRYGISPDQVKEINCTVAPLSLELCKNPSPRMALEGKFSLPHCAAAALVEGPLYYSHFTDEKMIDPEISALRKRVSLTKDPQLFTSQAKISVVLKSGKTYDFFSDIYSREKDSEIGKRLYSKVKDILVPLIGKKRTSQAIKSIEGLERVENMAKAVKDFS